MTLTNIRGKTRRLLGGITSVEYTDADILQSVNEYYHKAIAIAMRTQGEFEINAFEATTDLVADQSDYSLPTDILRVYRVEANYSGATNGWEKIRMLDQSQVDAALSNTDEIFATKYARVFSDSLYLEPTPTANRTAGLKVYFSDEVTELSDDADEPNIHEHIVSYLYHGACVDYCVENKINDQISYYEGKLKQNEQEIEYHYSRRLSARKTSIRRKKINFK